MKKFASLGTSIAAVLYLSGCGGGGSDSTPAETNTAAAPTAQGLWIGTTSTNRNVTGLVFADGSYYVLYSPVGNATAIAGVIQGGGSSSAGKFSSTDARDFNLEGLGVLPAAVSASFASKQSFNGSVSYAGGSSTAFTSAYDASYELTPSLATLAGTFTGQVTLSAGVQAATVTVSATGAISGGGGGCSLSGTASPRNDGNAHNLSISFGASPCFFANQTLSGIGYFNSSTKRLYAVAPNAARTDGILFVGTKP